MARQRMSHMDSVFVHLEDPTNLMMVTGVMILAVPIDYAHLGAVIEHRLLRFDRSASLQTWPVLLFAGEDA